MYCLTEVNILELSEFRKKRTDIRWSTVLYPQGISFSLIRFHVDTIHYLCISV